MTDKFEEKLWRDWHHSCPWHSPAIEWACKESPTCKGRDHEDECDKDECPVFHWFGAFFYELKMQKEKKDAAA